MASIARDIPLVDMFEQGLPPRAGGVLDQSAWFINLARQLKREDGRMKEAINGN